MDEVQGNDTIIVVGVTEKDGYGNLWVTPQGDGDRVKIAAKRANLHPLFEQGKAVILHWEKYMNKPYVADAKLVEGELPPPTKPEEPQSAVPDTMSKTPPRAVVSDPKNRAFCLSYAKDLAVADKIKPDKIINWACIFEDYLNGNLHIDDTQLSKLLTGFLTKAKEE